MVLVLRVRCADNQLEVVTLPLDPREADNAEAIVDDITRRSEARKQAMRGRLQLAHEASPPPLESARTAEEKRWVNAAQCGPGCLMDSPRDYKTAETRSRLF